MALTDEALRQIVAELYSRPKHEKVRVLTHKLLTDGLGIESTAIIFEQQIKVRGRIDALLGFTVFEFKSDLQAELKAVLSKMPHYLVDCEANSGGRCIGIATDGRDFQPYRLQNGMLQGLTPFSNRKDHPSELLDWLRGAISVQQKIVPTADAIRRELGKESLAYDVARSDLERLWRDASQRPDALLKRELWAKLLEKVYGSSVDSDDLFFQHTYLTIVAKAMALQVLGVAEQAPRDLLDGTPFVNAGITGAVEADFFDWVLDAPNGEAFVRQVSIQALRFKLDQVEHDVLKDLYESLIDPEQRHELGEYYTPDWLAAQIYDRAVSAPLTQRVLDPSCGSGTFLFHAVRGFLRAAEAKKLRNSHALTRCSDLVIGVDIHPVAVIIARVVYLLAIGEQRLRKREDLSIPVYLGDSVQWNTQTILTQKSIQIDVPNSTAALIFSASVTDDPHKFDRIISTMLTYSASASPDSVFGKWIDANLRTDSYDRSTLVKTYATLRDLHKEGRNHIWGYVARNLARPIWLSSDAQKVDVIVGNPPWLSFRFMSPAMQETFKTESERLGVSTFGPGGSSQQELSTYFFARCVALYLKQGGKIAFVLPFAVVQGRKQYAKFLTGVFRSVQKRKRLPGSVGGKPYKDVSVVSAEVRFDEAWVLSDRVEPVFKVPSSVLFATATAAGALPKTVVDFSGKLPRRDASSAEARNALAKKVRPWVLVTEPGKTPSESSTGYAREFRAGAIIFPNVFFRVREVEDNPLGRNAKTPEVESRRSALEKKPWKSIKTIRGPVEKEYLYPLLTGDSIAPYCELDPILSIIPLDVVTKRLLDAKGAKEAGALNLGKWLEKVERHWTRLAKTPNESIEERLDYYRQLKNQVPIRPVRVVYTASGANLVAARITNLEALVEHKLYWTAVDSIEEAQYLVAIFNSAEVHRRIEQFQSRGQWGARDIDKVAFRLGIPAWAATGEQKALAKWAADAERIAATALTSKNVTRVAARRIVLAALRATALDAKIDAAVAKLLGKL